MERIGSDRRAEIEKSQFSGHKSASLYDQAGANLQAIHTDKYPSAVQQLQLSQPARGCVVKCALGVQISLSVNIQHRENLVETRQHKREKIGMYVH
jgi:hypothetical protein